MEPTVRTDRIVSNNKLDIIIRDNKQGTCMSIDRAIPADRNVIKKILETISKYKELKIEIQRMCTLTLIVTGETGTISKSITQYLSNVRGA